MKNIDCIMKLIDYIENHLDEDLSLSVLASYIGYSPYHIHKLFTSIVGIPIHQYIVARRLSEAGKELMETSHSLVDIALASGYDSQRSFQRAFKAMYKTSPRKYRKSRHSQPLYPRYERMPLTSIQSIDMMIKTIYHKEMLLVGYEHRISKDFSAIGKCWHKLHKHKHLIDDWDMHDLIGINDYSTYQSREKPEFTYFAGAEVLHQDIPRGMSLKTLPATNYVTFSFRGKNEDSMQPIIDYIYKVWLPQSAYEFNDQAMYDMVHYGEEIDINGFSNIEYWIPII